MKRIIPAVSMVAALSCGTFAMADCGWYSGPSFPTGPRVAAAGVNHGGTLVVIGGRPYVGDGAAVHYLPAGGASWQIAPPLDGPVMQPASAVDGLGRLIVVGGYVLDDHYPNFFPLDTGFVYDVQAGVGDGIAPLPTPRAWFAFATDASSRLYIIGGRDQTGATVSVVERYDATSDAWSVLAPLPQPRSHAAAVDDGRGHVLVIGGADSAGIAQNTVFSFDVANGSWSAITSQPVACKGQAAVCGRDGRIYVSGGSPGNGQVANVYVLDPNMAAWSVGPSLATARSLAAVALDDDGVLWVMGGESGTLGTATVERLDTNIPAIDCNGNGVSDECDILWGASADCNANGVPDECDVVSGSSADANGNGIPDECELPGDLDRDGDVDMDDYALFSECVTGADGGMLTECDAADLEHDGDVDLRDFAEFQALFGG